MPPYHYCFLKNQRYFAIDFSLGRKACIFNMCTPMISASDGVFIRMKANFMRLRIAAFSTRFHNFQRCHSCMAMQTGKDAQ